MAAWSAITAPFKVAKKTVALKIAGIKAAKALKAAKLIKAATILKNLKKSPLILPVPFPVPIAAPIPFPVHAKKFPAKKLFEIPAPPTLEQALGPLKGVIAGATTALSAAGRLSSAAVKTEQTKSDVVIAPAVTPAPIPAPAPLPFIASAPLQYAAPASFYQLVPSIDFSQFGQYAAQPQFVADVRTPAETYGLPAATFGLPQ